MPIRWRSYLTNNEASTFCFRNPAFLSLRQKPYWSVQPLPWLYGPSFFGVLAITTKLWIETNREIPPRQLQREVCGDRRF